MVEVVEEHVAYPSRPAEASTMSPWQEEERLLSKVALMLPLTQVKLLTVLKVAVEVVKKA